MLKINVIVTISMYFIFQSDYLNGYKITTEKNQTVLIKLKFCEPSVIVKCLNVKPFRNPNHIFKHRLSNLKQWKRRKRVSGDSAHGEQKRVDDNEFELLPPSDRKIENSNVVVKSFRLTNNNSSSASLVKEFKAKWPVSLWRRYGLFTDDYIELINSHWLQFLPPCPYVNYGLGGFYILMMIIGCTGNGLVLLLYFRCSTLRTPGNILVANLAVSDFLMLAKTPIFIFNSFNQGPVLGKTGCVLYGFFGGLTGVTSIATLAAIALDRYWAVVRPLEPLRALTAIRARLLALGAWIYAAIFATVPALDVGYGRYVPEGYLTSCSFDYLTTETGPRCFIFIFFCAGWVAPFCTISFCYLNIFRVVACNRNVTAKNQDQRLSSRHVKEQVKRKAEIKLAVLVIAVIALFFISWTPYAVIALLGITGKRELVTPLTSMIPALFCKTAACVNPFVYIITHPNFRKEFHKLIGRRKTRHMQSTIKTTGYTTEASKQHRPSRDLSDTEVEIIEMKDIPPYQSENLTQYKEVKMKTISSKVSERQGSQRSASMKSFEESIVSPPSWYAKPKFAKKKSFHRRSTISIISGATDEII